MNATVIPPAGGLGRPRNTVCSSRVGLLACGRSFSRQFVPWYWSPRRSRRRQSPCDERGFVRVGVGCPISTTARSSVPISTAVVGGRSSHRASATRRNRSTLDKDNGKHWCDREGMRVMPANLRGSLVGTVVETGRGNNDQRDQARVVSCAPTSKFPRTRARRGRAGDRDHAPDGGNRHRRGPSGDEQGTVPTGHQQVGL